MRKHFKSNGQIPSASCFVVYYDGSLASIAALRHACQIAEADTEIVAVYLAIAPTAADVASDVTAGAENGKLILAGATVNAQMYGVSIHTEIVESRAKGPALVQLAAQHGNATIFLGIEQMELESQLNPFAEYVQELAPSDVVLVAV